jgi:hypothetical protein
VASNGRERWTPALNSPVLWERRTKSGTKKGSQKLSDGSTDLISDFFNIIDPTETCIGCDARPDLLYVIVILSLW